MAGLKSRPKDYLIGDIAKIYCRLYSEVNEKTSYYIVKAVFDSMKILLKDAEIGEKIKVVGWGTYTKCKPKQIRGTFQHYRTKKLITRKPTGVRISFKAAKALKEMVVKNES